MSDSCLVQSPLLVWPQAFVNSTEGFWNRVNQTDLVVQQHLDEERASELLRLAKALERDYPHMTRAINYYRTLVSGEKVRQPYQAIKFVQRGPNVNDRVSAIELGERPPPPKPRQLQVVFHRGE